LARHRTRFVARLRERAHEIVPIRGAPEFVESLRSDGWAVGIITGAWSDSARLKLEVAGFSGISVVSCDTFV